jgi:16S rRNA (adenine1518-N6/adenine1519-N6)-dimethyltransferase
MRFDLSALPPLRDVIEAHDLRAEKSLGQNFLLDLNITRRIVSTCKNIAGHHVIEIGPGPGGLTRALLESEALSLTAIEFDPRAIHALAELKTIAGDAFHIIHGDALAFDLTAITLAPRAIVANLPYNIATVLFINWLKKVDDFSFMTLMFQKEVAQRIVAKPNTEHYGRLAVLAGWLGEAKIAFDLHPKAFTPAPKVTSSVLSFIPKHDRRRDIEFKAVETITAAAFGQRRKMLRQSLKSLFGAETISVLEGLNINPEARAETLAVDEFLRLALYYQQHHYNND